jgi:hypothetical protein
MVALAVAAGTLTGCGSRSATTTPAATPTTAPAPVPTTVPAAVTPGPRPSDAATQSDLDPFTSSGAGGGSAGTGGPGSTTTVPASAAGGGSGTTTAPSTASATTVAPSSAAPSSATPTTTATPNSSPTTASATTASPTTASPTTGPAGTSATTAPATTTTVDPNAGYVEWAAAHGQPDFDKLSQTLALITRAIADRDDGHGSGRMHTDGARLVRQAVGMESQAGPPIPSLTTPWHVVLHSYVAYGRSVRSRRGWSTLIADLRGISAALAAYDRAADAAGVGPDS